MRILIYGDIYGRVGRKAFAKEYDSMQQKYNPDFTIANIENITSGRGPVSEHAQYIEDFGVDLMTLGDHSFDNMPNIGEYFKKKNGKIIRPANFYDTPEGILPGVGYQILEKKGKRLLVIQLLGEAFMNHKVYNPFLKIDEILQEVGREAYDACIVEFHRETTAELYGMAHYLRHKSSLVYGTHTHIQTNDAHILEGGTALIGDIGMNGPFDSVIGAEFESVRKRFLTGIQKGKIEQKLTKKYIINALVVDIDDTCNTAKNIENISFTGHL